MSPKLSYLCLFENPTREAARALIRQFVLVREADRMGYDEIWLGELHGEGNWPSAAAVALLGHLAGVTSHARIGAMALLPAWHDPVRLAGDVATLDLLSKGRFNLGVSRGGPFAPRLANSVAGTAADTDAVALEALELMTRLWNEDRVSFHGAHFRVDPLTLVPRPAQAIPTWIATTTPAVVRHAARQGHGLMAAATCTPAYARELLGIYRDQAPAGDPRMVLARFAFSAASRDEAVAVARPYLEQFAARMAARGVTAKAGRSTLDVDELLAMSLVGSHAEVAEHITRLQEEVGVHSLALIPTSAQFDTVKHCLADFVDEVRPLLPDY